MQLAKGLAIVTGGSRGIGRGIVQRLAADGYHVLFTFVANQAMAEDVVRQVEANSGRATAIACDLSAPADIDALFAKSDSLGERLEVLVNNAGIWEIEPFEAITGESFSRMVNVNMGGPVFLAQAAAPRICDGGRLIFISSSATRTASPAYLVYAMTKSAIAALVCALAVQLGPRGVTVNGLAPGLTDTDLAAFLQKVDPAAISGAIAMTALNRIGTPSDIAGAVSMLASDDSRWITGQIIDCTGGLRL